MRIEPDIKLDYASVLMRPKRSVLGSRKDVDLQRRFRYRHYKPSEPGLSRREEHGDFKGIPLMASNMDGVGTLQMADVLADKSMFTCLVKSYKIKELVDWFTDKDRREQRLNHTAYSLGILEDDLTKFRAVNSVCVTKRRCDVKFIIYG